MPTYEYVCRECGQHLEVVQSFKDAPLTTCGNCNGALRKVFSAAGIIFKGSGYYVTDTRAKPEAAAAKTGGESAKDGEPAKAGGDTDSTKGSEGAGTSTDTGRSSTGTSATEGTAESA